MWHLQEQEMVGFVFGDLTADDQASCAAHLRTCPDCRSGVDRIRQAAELLGKQPMEPAPPFAWSRIKARIERSGVRRDWGKPAWTPLVLGNVTGIALAILTISLAGAWFENGAVWHTVRTWPLAQGIGPRNLAALVFFGIGALVTLALTPILWWESRHRHKRTVK